MAYIGFGPLNTFSPVPSKDSFTGDGSTTTFDLENEVVFGGENALEVFVDNVRQEPGTGKAYTLDLDGNLKNKRITFSAAPASGAAIYVINDKTSNTTIISPTDLNGVEFILDADADTSITADTDDRIDFKLNNVDHIQLGTSSGDTTIKIATDAKDLQFLQADGRNILEINDAGYVALGNGATGSGQLRIYEDTDNGTNFSAFQVGSQSADITYTLPTADGTSGFQLTTNGSGVLSWAAAQIALANDGNNRIVTGTGSAGLNAEANLTFDGSTLTNAGATQLNSTLTVGANDQGYDVILYGDTASANMTWDTSVDDLIFNGAARIVIPDGQLVLGSTAVTSTAAEINILDGGNNASSVTLVDADRIIVNDNGTMKQVAVSALNAYTSASIAADDISAGDAAVNITTSSGNITIDAAAGDADIIFKGTDDSADITALTLDMSAAGAATFNDKIIATELDISGDVDVDGTTNLDIVDIDGAVNISDTVTIATTNKIIFNDASQFIQGASATVLDIAATDEIELTATLIEIVGNSTVSGTLGVTGVVTANAGVVVDEITIDGDTLTATDDFIIDAVGEIILDADNEGSANGVQFKDGGIHYGSIFRSSSDLNLKSIASDEDIVFMGNDGGAEITALTLDMSDAGTATFNHDIKLGDNSKVIFGAGSDLEILHSSSSGNSFISDVGTGSLICFS